MRVIHVLRKPLSEGTVAANVLKHGTGALHIDRCRVATTDTLDGGASTSTTAAQKGNEGWTRPWMQDEEARSAHAARVRENVAKAEDLGRWPGNLILDHTPACSEEGCDPGCPARAVDEQGGSARFFKQIGLTLGGL